ncbi:hypothetical protein SACE_2959 [Saccharopolyspora erythraea NRRL 2338]|uniref:Uncharacterized protein n=2 Tax=Saccharopolyspora erythraea TaxID=1836 RepID=A4FDW2_SACEN|nr:hypothetical protein N599_31715 [Saccharopolyspora erythraea D]QRK92531.1 hypothetical protein JQX30_15220 [Saccharopolyspora erythraea]CAM02237.1 hypothetical protein SACE_2959 [Saccharopolyspora erythraea NRRL 2338]
MLAVNRSELVARLRRLGLDGAEYVVPGYHDLPGSPEEYYYLRPGGGGWEVGVHERGRDRPSATFATEDEACGYLHGLLADRAGRAEQTHPMSADELRVRSEEAQRTAWRQYRQS